MQVKVDDVFSLKSGKYITLEETNYEQERYLFVNKLDENDNPSKKFVVFKCTDKGLLEEKDNDKLNVLLKIFSDKVNDKLELINGVYKVRSFLNEWRRT